MRFIVGLGSICVLSACSGAAADLLGPSGEGGPDAVSSSDANDAYAAANDSGDATVPDGSTRDVADTGGDVADGSDGDTSAGDVVDEPNPPLCILNEAGVPDLSYSGIGPFSIEFMITTTTVNYVALLNQRFQCTSNYPDFWDLRYRAPTETFEFELSDSNGHDASGKAGARLNDGTWHSVSLSRMGGTWTVTVDNVVTGTGDAGAALENLAFGDLFPLKIGNDICVGEEASGILPSDHYTISQICLSHYSGSQ